MPIVIAYDFDVYHCFLFLFFIFQSKFYKIQRENPQLGPWLIDVQRTVENLFAVRRKCDTLAKSRQR